MVSIIYLYTFHCQCILALQKKQFRQNNKIIQTKTSKIYIWGKNWTFPYVKNWKPKGKLSHFVKIQLFSSENHSLTII